MSTATRELFAAFRRLPAPFWVLAGGTFVNRFATFLVPFITLYLVNRGYTPSEAGVAVLSYAVGGFACSFIAGPLADRFGRNRVMAVALLCEAGCVLTMGFAETYWSIVGLMALAGFVAQGAHPATQALIADIVPDGDRVAAQLAIRVAINAGWSLGPAVAGFVIKYADSYFPLFVADAATSTCLAILSWFFLPRGRPVGREGARWGPALAALRQCPAMIAIMIATLCASFVFRQLCTTVNLHLKDHGYGEEIIGLVQSLNGAIIILFEIPLTAATAHISYRRGVAWGFLLLGAGLTVNLLGGNVWLVVLGMTVFTIGEMLCLPRHAAWVQQLSPEGMRGRFSGLAGFAWLGGNLLGSWGGLALYGVSPDALWALCGVAGIIALAVLRENRGVAAGVKPSAC
jgi:MFS family permease